MALSKREKGIATLTVAVVGTLGLYQYVVSPYLDSRTAVANELRAATAQQEQGTNTLQLQRRLNQEWRAMTSGGLKQDPGDAEQQLYEAVRDWAREANFTIGTSDPQRIARTNDRTQIVKLRVKPSPRRSISRLRMRTHSEWNVEINGSPDRGVPSRSA